MSAPTVLSIAGSDPSGGAGIQADLKTFSALGAYGCAAMTALTAQSTQGVTGIHPVPPEFVREQVATLVDEAGFSPDVAGHHVGMTRAINDGRVVGRRPGTTVLTGPTTIDDYATGLAAAAMATTSKSSMTVFASTSAAIFSSWSSLRSFTRVLGSTPVSARALLAVVRPTPKM